MHTLGLKVCLMLDLRERGWAGEEADGPSLNPGPMPHLHLPVVYVVDDDWVSLTTSPLLRLQNFDFYNLCRKLGTKASFLYPEVILLPTSGSPELTSSTEA